MPHHSASAVIPNASYLTQPTAKMPEPAPAPAPVIPPQFAHYASGAPVVPRMPQAPTPQRFAHTPPVIPPTPAAFPQPQQAMPVPPPFSDAEGELEEFEMHAGQPLAPGQYARQQPITYTRPASPRLRHNPLPTPPKDLFELSPFIGLLKDLHRPPEETLLRRTATSPPYATGYLISPTGSHASREKKHRKGLFRSLSNRLGGKSKHDDDPQVVYQPVVFTTGPIPAVFPTAAYSAAMPPPGVVWPQSAGGPTPEPAPAEVRSHSPRPPQAPPFTRTFTSLIPLSPLSSITSPTTTHSPA